MATAAGRRIVEMVWEDLRPRDILTTAAFENAVTAAMALGGSTNAIIHLIAMAGRAGAALDLDRFDQLSRRTPFLANIRPSGKFLMEDFYYAGGLRGLLRRLGDLLHTDCLTVNGRTLGENVADAIVSQRRRDRAARAADRSRRRAWRCCAATSRRSGAVIKHTAADRRLLQHAGPAVVFRDYNDMDARIDDPELPVTAGLGARAAACRAARRAGHAGVGHAADSEEAARAGRARHGPRLRRPHERHQLRRLRAARRAGVVRRRPARAGPRRRHHRARRPGAPAVASACDEELARRRADWTPPEPQYPRGFGLLYSQHVTQADKGCDFDFLEGTAPIADPEIH